MNQERRMGPWLRGLGLGLVVIGMAAHPAMAQEGTITDSPLFHNVKDPKFIATQVRTALPAYEHGLGLLTSGADAEVPPTFSTPTASTSVPARTSALTLSPGADTLTRLPKPLEKSSEPL